MPSGASRTRRWWDEFFLVAFVGVPVAAAIALSHVVAGAAGGGAVRPVLAETTRGTLFSALIGFAALLLSVMLAVLTILTTMDERPVVKRLKEAEGRMYARLIHAMLGPIFVSLALAAFSIVCITLSAEPDTFAVVLVSATLGLAATTLAQGAYVASLIAKLLTFEGRPALITATDHPPKPAAPKPPPAGE